MVELLQPAVWAVELPGCSLGQPRPHLVTAVTLHRRARRPRGSCGHHLPLGDPTGPEIPGTPTQMIDRSTPDHGAARQSLPMLLLLLLLYPLLLRLLLLLLSWLRR